MPEGDTIHRAAARLRPVLEGQTLVRFEAQRLAGSRPRVGETIGAVDAVGKHLLIRFSGGLTLETHMRMTGSWRLVAVGGRWPKPAHLLRARIDVDGWQALCFSAPVVRTFPTKAEHRELAYLGPDLCLEAPDVDACLVRMSELCTGSEPLGEVLLDQRIANGVGNVFKSEVCWAERVDPFTPIGAVPDGLRRQLIETSARLLLANLGTDRRTTVPGGLAVYGRDRQSCRRCGSPVRKRTLGDLARVTYWCPRCQPPGGGSLADRDQPSGQ